MILYIFVISLFCSEKWPYVKESALLVVFSDGGQRQTQLTYIKTVLLIYFSAGSGHWISCQFKQTFMSTQVKGQESMAKEECTRKTPNSPKLHC